MNQKELNEIFNMQMCMLDKGEGNDQLITVHGTGSKHPDPDSLVLYYSGTSKDSEFKIGRGREYFFVKEEFPNLCYWCYLP